MTLLPIFVDGCQCSGLICCILLEGRTYQAGKVYKTVRWDKPGECSIKEAFSFLKWTFFDFSYFTCHTMTDTPIKAMSQHLINVCAPQRLVDGFVVKQLTTKRPSSQGPIIAVFLPLILTTITGPEVKGHSYLSLISK
jgi:hypothetical protein